MAEVRKSGKQTAARQRAREKAAEFREKQDKLEELATDYFVTADSIADIQASIDKEIDAVRKRGEKVTEEARAKAQAVIASMLDLGVPRNEVADRLGLTTREVKKPAIRKATAHTPPPAELAPSSEDVSGA
ncbi:hypothetical protein [Frondihabitans cladoniiphilus]|uniref:Uncharacterized protein n=1 Tax=Frondihabitans cladoniiphilus TaxID=715785 RepID=A0ABP8WET4_9MICO